MATNATLILNIVRQIANEFCNYFIGGRFHSFYQLGKAENTSELFGNLSFFFGKIINFAFWLFSHDFHHINDLLDKWNGISLSGGLLIAIRFKFVYFGENSLAMRMNILLGNHRLSFNFEI